MADTVNPLREGQCDCGGCAKCSWRILNDELAADSVPTMADAEALRIFRTTDFLHRSVKK